jgi:hypothetical protein
MTQSQQPRVQDVGAQRAAMRKLSFLVGKWSGEARLLRAGGTVELTQTEEAQYKLDGLVLMIEAVGRNKSDGKLALQALGLISYDDEAGAYHMRAFNDGRWLESDVKLDKHGKGLTWGFVMDEIKTHSVLRINEKGQWTEVAELTIGSQPARKLIELTVSPRK